jgi:hypothetical protein
MFVIACMRAEKQSVLQLGERALAQQRPQHDSLVPHDRVRRAPTPRDFRPLAGREPSGGASRILATQLVTQRVGESDRPPAERAAHGGVGQEHDCIPGEAADLGDELAPLPARLPPALVAGVVAEPQEDGERESQQGEWRGREVAEQAGPQMVQQRERGGERHDGQHARRDGGHHRAAQDDQKFERTRAGTDDQSD